MYCYSSNILLLSQSLSFSSVLPLFFFIIIYAIIIIVISMTIIFIIILLLVFNYYIFVYLLINLFIYLVDIINFIYINFISCFITKFKLCLKKLPLLFACYFKTTF